MTKKELQAQAQEKGIQFSTKATKAELENLLAQEAPAQEAEEQEAPAQEAEEQEAEEQEAEEQEAEAQEAEAQEAQAIDKMLKNKFLVKTDKGGYYFSYPLAFVETMTVISDGQENLEHRFSVKTCKKSFTIPKQVFKDVKKSYAESVGYYYFCALEAQAQAQLSTLKDVDTSDFSIEAENLHNLKMDTISQNISTYAMISSLFVDSPADGLAQAQGLFLAGDVLPVLTGQLITDLYDLHKAFRDFNLTGLEKGTASYTDLQVQNMNQYRLDVRTKLEPFTDKTDLHHAVKVSISNEDMFSWLCWSQGKNEKFDYDGKSGKVRFEKDLIQFLMFKCKTAPKK